MGYLPMFWQKMSGVDCLTFRFNLLSDLEFHTLDCCILGVAEVDIRGPCRFTLERCSHLLGLSIPTVRKYTQSLIERGFLSHVHRLVEINNIGDPLLDTFYQVPLVFISSLGVKAAVLCSYFIYVANNTKDFNYTRIGCNKILERTGLTMGEYRAAIQVLKDQKYITTRNEYNPKTRTKFNTYQVHPDRLLTALGLAGSTPPKVVKEAPFIPVISAGYDGDDFSSALAYDPILRADWERIQADSKLENDKAKANKQTDDK